MQPLRRKWETVKAEAVKGAEKRDNAKNSSARTKARNDLTRILMGFADEIGQVKVLDPACGSGNFLYVALKQLLDLQKEVITFSAELNVGHFFPSVSPEQLYGIELNSYAHELAQATVWIGYIQWLNDNGFGAPSEPILKPLENIKQMDAILAYDDNGEPVEPDWPEADVIIGNPPFLGGGKIRAELGNNYTENLFTLYGSRIPNFSDLVCYWFERSRELIERNYAKRSGLLATNSIRGGANRRVLDRIKESGDIFMAWSDRAWILDGAAVRVSMIGFDDGMQSVRILNGSPVTNIFPNLSYTVDLSRANILKENQSISFQGPSPKGPFDIDADKAAEFLQVKQNINGNPNSDVVKPVLSAIDLVGKARHKWTIDFAHMTLEEASLYERPFEYVKQHVYPIRSKNRRSSYARLWWQYAESRQGLREALKNKNRFIATPRVSKHRIFVWVDAQTLANDGTIVFARDDDYFFSILHSKVHELWALRQGTSLEDRPRYTPTSTFETFPFPWPLAKNLMTAQ